MIRCFYYKGCVNLNNNCEFKTIYITTKDISIFDTTGKFTEKDIESIKEEFANNMNNALNCAEDC